MRVLKVEQLCVSHVLNRESVVAKMLEERIYNSGPVSYTEHLVRQIMRPMLIECGGGRGKVDYAYFVTLLQKALQRTKLTVFETGDASEIAISMAFIRAVSSSFVANGIFSPRPGEGKSCWVCQKNFRDVYVCPVVYHALHFWDISAYFETFEEAERFKIALENGKILFGDKPLEVKRVTGVAEAA